MRQRLAAVLDIARTAGAIITAARANGISTRLKPDGSPQTNADRAAEACIIAGLTPLWPDVPIIAEESCDGMVAYDPAAPYWLVDPLDGTKSFVAGGDDYSVNIALMLNRRPAFGVLHAPASGALYWNDAAGAWRQDNPTAPILPLQTRAPPAHGLTMITGQRTYTGATLRRWMAGEHIATHMMLSSALKFACLAMGQADIYPRFSNTMEWDNAAGEAILYAAGGSVTLPDGRTPLPYGQASLTHAGFIARSTRL
jgi:3'(2'), 5'-bisphosphate nucleotidase